MMSSFDPVEKLWRGPAIPYPFPKDVYMGEKLLEILEKSPESILTISHEENYSMTRGEARRLSINFARNLMKLGIQPDDVVGVICRNSNNLTVIVYGCMIVGAPINPLEVSFSREDIVQLFDQTKPKLVFCDSDIFWTVKKAMDDLQSDARIFTVLDKIPGAPHVTKLLESSESNEMFVAPKFDKPADEKLVSILCTSGTTGKPKGVGQSHASLLLFTNFPQPPFPFTSLSFSPIYWISGFFSAALSAFRTFETKVQSMKPYSNELFGELQEKYKIGMTFLPPSQIYSFLQSPVADNPAFESLKMIYTGGSLVSHQLLEELRQKFPKLPLGIGYGLTETSITMVIPGRVYENELTVGSVNSNLIVKIVDEEETKLGPKEAGEIRVKPHLPFLVSYEEAFCIPQFADLISISGILQQPRSNSKCFGFRRIHQNRRYWLFQRRSITYGRGQNERHFQVQRLPC